MITVQEEDFDIGAEIKVMTRGRTEIGGVATFTGLVRDFIAGNEKNVTTRIRAMTLEHYPAMTERMLTQIEEEANRRWDLDAVRIIHRIGMLKPGDNIVFVACAAAHREDALQACSFLIDWLKTKAPFWKKEDTAQGEKWVKAKASDDALAARWEES